MEGAEWSEVVTFDGRWGEGVVVAGRGWLKMVPAWKVSRG